MRFQKLLTCINKTNIKAFNDKVRCFFYVKKVIKIVKIYIENKGIIYQPTVLESIVLQSDIEGSPSSINFDVYKDDVINFVEGNSVRLNVSDKDMFFGYIFKKSRTKDNIINVTAYDQIRYLKNKDTYNFVNVKATDIVCRIANDFSLSLGEIEDTSHIIESQIEVNTTLLDMIQNAIDTTYSYKKTLYVLFDDAGKLSLRNSSNMIKDILITNSNAKDFYYETSIDDNTYNKVKLTFDNKKTGLLEIYHCEDNENIKKWGILQYFDTIQEEENGTQKASALLELCNKTTNVLTIDNVIGNTEVRAGCMVYVDLDINGVVINSLMLVKKCVHTFTENVHLMDLELLK